MGILDTVQKLEKRLEKLAERSDVPIQPIEIRKAALDEIEDRVAPAGRSRRVFPYNRITLEVMAVDAAQRAAMEAVLGEGGDLAAAVVDRLTSSGCPKPRGLAVRLKLVKRAGPDWDTGRVFRVRCERVDEVPAPAAPAAARGAGQLVVVKGEATRRACALGGERTNIGRLAEVVDKDKRVVRRNHLVFTEREDGVNQTVSRAHAHIARTPGGEYRLFDDHSAYGTRIFRAGRTLSLPAGSPRGTKLQPGDEIYLGQACVRFEMKSSA
jgi:FHA domain